MECYRQGDVLVIRVDDVPSSAVSVPRDAGRLVLAYGEVTGHAHAVFADRLSWLRASRRMTCSCACTAMKWSFCMRSTTRSICREARTA